METYRIFVSSPGDALFERQRVDRVVARLNGELAGAARLVAVRWETEFYSAHDTFQTQIPASTECSVVVAIFRARIGTELPPGFTLMPDGTPYPSGTAYEVLTAIAKRQLGGELPDVFVFRHPDPPVVQLDDHAKEEETRRQWDRLKAFFGRWFLTPEGHFKAAFQTFSSTDDFEAQLERLLRDWLQRRLATGGAVTWPVATMGSPYPGLQSFGPRYAPVFFGRGRDVARASEAWSEAAGRGWPFLIVVGASGSGKSSLVRAGLVPRLTTPGVVEAVDVWRTASLRPSDSPDGALAALAHALMQQASEPAPEGTDQRPALPEIADGDYRTPAELAALLAHGDAASVKPILAALEKVAQQEQRRQAIDRPVRCDLVILVDQLDELFAASVDAGARRRFAAVLSQLVATGRVWVVATLRADLYELYLKDEILFQLKDKGVAYDLTPPTLADMAEVVRGPARAANLKWEADPGTRESLDERLIRDIERPDLLPIVQFVLDRLFQQRLTRGEDVILTHAAYQALGTLDGAIETAAEGALAALGEPVAAALPRLLRTLVVHGAAVGTGGAHQLTLRQAPLDAAAYDETSRRLVGALIDARILVSGRDQAGVPVVGLAHQRVIEAWSRAKDIIAQSADLLRVREEVEEARRRWEAAGKRNDLLLRPGLPLSEAEHAAAVLQNELPAQTAAFIDKSGRAARLRQRLTAAAALIFLCLALATGVLGFVAQAQKLNAQRAAAEAQSQRAQAEAARAQAEDARAQADTQRRQAESARQQAEQQRRQAENARQQADAQRHEAELRLGAADELLDGTGKAEELRQCLASTARAASQPPPRASRDYMVGRWHVDQGIGSTDVDWRADGTCETKSFFDAPAHALDMNGDVCTWKFEKLGEHEFAVTYQSIKLGANYPKRLSFRIVNPVRIHNTDLDYDASRIICPAQEIAIHQKDVAERQKQADADPGNPGYQHDVADSLDRLAVVLSAQGDYKTALSQFNAAEAIRKALADRDPKNPVWQRDLSVSYERIGMARQALNDPEAVAAFQHSLDIRRQLYLANRGNFVAQHDLADGYERTGTALKNANDRKRALELYQQSLPIRKGLAKANPGNAALQIELAVGFYLASTVSEPSAAKEALTQALAVLGSLEREQKLTGAQTSWPRLLRAELAKLP